MYPIACGTSTKVPACSYRNFCGVPIVWLFTTVFQVYGKDQFEEESVCQ
jgi:hypothetical protein